MSQKYSNIKINTPEEHIIEIALNKPERRNALSRETLDELQSIFFNCEDATRVIVLSAVGDVFCAGGDLKELGRGEDSDVEFDNAIERVIDAIKNAPVPVIAAVEGACLGAGVDLLLACDLSVIADDAYLQIPAVRLGLLYSPVGIKRMRRRLGHATIKRLLLLGEKLNAVEAVTAGAVSHVSVAGQARTKAMELATLVTSGVPAAVNASKRYLAALENDTLDDEKWEVERRRLLASIERQDAVKEKRNNLKTRKN